MLTIPLSAPTERRPGLGVHRGGCCAQACRPALACLPSRMEPHARDPPCLAASLQGGGRGGGAQRGRRARGAHARWPEPGGPPPREVSRAMRTFVLFRARAGKVHQGRRCGRPVQGAAYSRHQRKGTAMQHCWPWGCGRPAPPLPPSPGPQRSWRFPVVRRSSNGGCNAPSVPASSPMTLLHTSCLQAGKGSVGGLLCGAA